MKTAVVFYTRDGSTRIAAQVLAEDLDADVFELEEASKRGRSTFCFVWAGFSASFGIKSRLKDDFSAQMKAYERICIGTPVWAGRAVPALNAFLQHFDPRGKEMIIFTVQADPSPTQKCAQKMAKILTKKGAHVQKTMSLYGAGVGKIAQRGDIERQISAQL